MQQKTYTAAEHRLPLDSIDPDALFIVEKLKSAGHLAYIVGGSLRDILLGKRPKDFDISTSAVPEEIRRVFRNAILIGKRFRLAHVRFGRKIIEVSTFRSGDIQSEALITRDNEWGSPEQDALRRDFTINGLFYDPQNEVLIDYVNGYHDIQKRQLRSIGNPYLRFKQDPVRMIRLIKFEARFGLSVEEEARLALFECRHEILKSSPTRILEELLRMLESGAAKPFFKLMTDNGLLQLMMPLLSEFLETDHGEEIYDYLEEVDTTFHEPSRPPLARPILLSCLVFPPLMKRINTHFEERGQHPHLGEIQRAASQLIDELFQPFFLLPRRQRIGLITILSEQFRLTPFDKKSKQRRRVSRDPDFPLAVKFLELRAALEPALKETFDEWNALLTHHPVPAHPQPEGRPRRRRRRRRR